MIVASIFLGSHTLELHNSVLGTEIIKFDNKVVSSKFSFFGADHLFTVHENGVEVSYRVKFRVGSPIAYDIYKNNEPFVISPKNQFWRMGIVFLFVIVFWELIQGRLIPF